MLKIKKSVETKEILKWEKERWKKKQREKKNEK